MRVFFAISPGLDHLYPVVGLAWALRTSAHQVVVATSGLSTEAAARAGLPARDVSPDADFGAVFPRRGTQAERAAAMREQGLTIAKTLQTPDAILEKFARVSDLMVDGMARLARTWRPDVIVYSRLQGAALVVARELGIPAVEHGFNFLRDGALPGRFLRYLTPSYERMGVPAELPSITSLYFAQESMMQGKGEGWGMRLVPFHGGGVLPDWMAEPKERPRVCITLGTTVPRMAGITGLRGVMEAAGAVDAEFVLALGDDPDLDQLGTLPDNVRVVGWTPLSTLLETCDGIIHHGGAQTTLASAHTGVPQLVLPHGADNWINGAMVERYGIGMQREPDEVDAETLGMLLEDDALRKSAQTLAGDLAVGPGPDEIVVRLSELAGAGERQ
jgi:UDP:flavonoid glycosyltransferase YjiC (YdhE family)